MRALFVLVLAACELKPAPKPPPPTAGDAGAGSAEPEVTRACVEVGVKAAAVWIDTAESPTEKAALEQDRTKIVRRVAETCTRAGWSEAARSCALAATTRAAVQACQPAATPG